MESSSAITPPTHAPAAPSTSATVLLSAPVWLCTIICDSYHSRTAERAEGQRETENSEVYYPRARRRTNTRIDHKCKTLHHVYENVCMHASICVQKSSLLSFCFIVF